MTMTKVTTTTAAATTGVVVVVMMVRVEAVAVIPMCFVFVSLDFRYCESE